MNCKDEHPELVALLRFCIYFHLTMEIKQMPINMMTIDLQHLTAIHQEPVHGSRWNESEMRSALTWGSLEPMSWANFHRRCYNYSMKFLGSFFNLGSFLSDWSLFYGPFVKQGFSTPNPPIRLLDELLPNFVTPLKRLPEAKAMIPFAYAVAPQLVDGWWGSGHLLQPPKLVMLKNPRMPKPRSPLFHGQVAKWQ